MLSVILNKTEEISLKEGRPWVFSNEVNRFEGKIESGCICNVYSSDYVFVGKGFFNAASKIMVRMLSLENEEINEDFFRKRILSAWQYRNQLGFTNNARVIFAEADLLPGLIVDKYGEYLSVQFLSLGMNNLKDMIIKLLVEVFSPKGIYERSDVTIREKEGLPLFKGPIYGGNFSPLVTIIENGIYMQVDLENGQKTGYFLDQKMNRYALRNYVKDKVVLDCFSHTGGFSLHAAYFGAKQVTAVDISQKACDDILINAGLNHFNNITCVCDDVFHFLREEENNQKYDVIVLDPPAFTKSKDTVKQAYKGYKEINLQALKMLPVGGILFTFSCSQHMVMDLFLQMLKEASIDAGRVVQMESLSIQSPDHPVLLSDEDSLYLKCCVLRVVK